MTADPDAPPYCAARAGDQQLTPGLRRRTVMNGHAMCDVRAALWGLVETLAEIARWLLNSLHQAAVQPAIAHDNEHQLPHQRSAANDPLLVACGASFMSNAEKNDRRYPVSFPLPDGLRLARGVPSSEARGLLATALRIDSRSCRRVAASCVQGSRRQVRCWRSAALGSHGGFAWHRRFAISKGAARHTCRAEMGCDINAVAMRIAGSC